METTHTHHKKQTTTTTTPRRPGGEKRGNSYDRAARKRRLLAAYGNRCAHCGNTFAPADLQQDRVDPLGSYTFANLVLACGPCNKRRSNHPDRFPLNMVAITTHPDLFTAIAA